MVWVLTPFERGIARPTFTHVTYQCRPHLPHKCHFGVENNFLELAVDKKYKGCSGFVLARVVCLTRIRTKPPYIIVGVKLLGRRVGAHCDRSGSARVAPA